MIYFGFVDLEAAGSPGAWFSMTAGTPMVSVLFLIQTSFYMVAAWTVLILWMLRQKSWAAKRQTSTLITATLIPYIFSLTTSIFSILAPQHEVPDMQAISTVLVIAGTWISISRYSLMGISSHDVLGNLFSYLQEIIIITDNTGYIQQMNHLAEILTGFSAEDQERRHLSSIIKPESKVLGLLLTPTNQGKAVSEDTEILDIAGNTVPVDITARILYSRAHTQEGIMIIGHDLRPANRLKEEIEAKHRVEDSLIASEMKYRATVEALDDALVLITTDLRIALCNRPFLALARKLLSNQGVHAVGKSWDDLNLPIFQNRRQFLSQVFETPKTGVFEEAVSLGKQELYYEIRSIPVEENNIVSGIILIIRDITRQKMNQQALNRSEKIESIGVLAGGIAHDFNNILTAILGNINLAGELCSDTEVKELLQLSLAAGSQAKDLTSQLLTFARGGAPIKKTASIEQIIRDTASFILSGSAIDYSIIKDEVIGTTQFDPAQIAGVTQNIILNAKQAMENQGRIIIRISSYEKVGADSLPLKPGKYILVRIRDNGPGIPEDMRKRIFDPYFTTKEDGNGLGLAMAYSIMKNHQGFLDVDSIPGDFTEFSLYLPLIDAEEESKEEVMETDVSKGSGHILYMDDDATIRKIAERILAHLGYKVTTAVNGEEAIRALDTHVESPDPVTHVFLDLTVKGGMGGEETGKLIKSRFPRMPVIVCSGYNNAPILSSPDGFGFDAALKKPFTIEEIRAVLSKFSS
jgi:PAS domain S-box-containing protein